MRRLVCGLLAGALVGCGAEAVTTHAPIPPPSPGASAVPPPSAEQLRAELFERLVAIVRRDHVFSPNTESNLGRRWDDDLPSLRAEFRAATTDDALLVALTHFDNSLHDGHCRFRPAGKAVRLKLGFTVGVETTPEGPSFFVESVAASASDALKAQLTPGDVVVRVDGIPSEELVRRHALDSRSNSWPNIAFDVAEFLTNRRAPTSLAREGTLSTWTVRARGGGPERVVTAAWARSSHVDDGGDIALDYASKDCVFLAPKTYGSYTLAARGYRSCTYTSEARRYRDYPIVRLVSFQYDELPHGPLVDFELIRATLGRTHAKGVIVDVQDNGGGINPNLFIEWWAKKPWVDTDTFVVLDESLVAPGTALSDGHERVDNLTDAIRGWYSDALKSRTAGERFTAARPNMCKADTCRWDNRYSPTHRVTNLPAALIVGPVCGSSCDAFAWHFDRDKMGPIVGRQPSAAFTTHRAHFDVALREGGPSLGTLDIAVSYDAPTGEQTSIEGAPIHIDVPVPKTFENRDRFDQLLVDAAIGALEKPLR